MKYTNAEGETFEADTVEELAPLVERFEDMRFKQEYSKSPGDPHILSGRLRDMEKRAKAANQRADKAEKELREIRDKSDPDDWIEWKGDVIRPTDKRVSIKFRSGYVSHYQDPRHWSWVHVGKEGDIIAYRLARP